MSLILIIDDDVRFRRIARLMLSSAGHAVMEADDGEAGMKLLRQRQPALVITDIIMPKKEGLETIREIRQTSPETKVIAISGSNIASSGTFYLEAAEKLGADAVLDKPFREADFLKTVARVLSDS